MYGVDHKWGCLSRSLMIKWEFYVEVGMFR